MIITALVTDADLVVRARSLDQKAFEALFDRHKDRVYNFINYAIGNSDDAADLTQAVFIKAWKSMDGFRGDCSFASWLYTISVSKISDHGKKRQPSAFDPRSEAFLEVESSQRGPSEGVMNREQSVEVQKALMRLDPEDREIILLRDMMDVSYPEIAIIFKLAVSSVRVRLHRARMAFKEVLYGTGKQVD